MSQIALDVWNIVFYAGVAVVFLGVLVLLGCIISPFEGMIRSGVEVAPKMSAKLIDWFWDLIYRFKKC